jgi:mRNA interferase MazF
MIKSNLIEIWGVRPCLIVSANVVNMDSQMVTIVPLSKINNNFGRKRLRKTDIYIKKEEGNLDYNSKIVLNQIRSIDIKRIRKKLGTVSDEKVILVKHCLTNILFA